MTSMFKKKEPNVIATQKVKDLVNEKFKLDDKSTLSIAELNCHKPDCSPKETVITIRDMDGNAKNWRIHKPINEIVDVDINMLDKKKGSN